MTSHQWKMEDVTSLLLHTALLRGTSARSDSEGTLEVEVWRRARLMDPISDALVPLKEVTSKIHEMDSAILALRDGLLSNLGTLLGDFYTVEMVVEKLRHSPHWDRFLGAVKCAVTDQYNEQRAADATYSVTKVGRVTFPFEILLTEAEILALLHPNDPSVERSHATYSVSSVGSIHFEEGTELSMREISFFLGNDSCTEGEPYDG